jgi:hypothetical protein
MLAWIAELGIQDLVVLRGDNVLETRRHIISIHGHKVSSTNKQYEASILVDGIGNATLFAPSYAISQVLSQGE